MNVSWFKYIAVGAFVVGWLKRSLKDGQIQKNELVELIDGVFEAIGIEKIPIVDDDDFNKIQEGDPEIRPKTPVGLGIGGSGSRSVPRFEEGGPG